MNAPEITVDDAPLIEALQWANDLAERRLMTPEISSLLLGPVEGICRQEVADLGDQQPATQRLLRLLPTGDLLAALQRAEVADIETLAHAEIEGRAA